MATSSISSMERPLRLAASSIWTRTRAKFSATFSMEKLYGRGRACQCDLFAGKARDSRAQPSVMKRFSFLLAALFVFACANLFAQGKIDLQTGDTILGILQKNVGQTVELRMKSGEKIAGKVEKVGDKLVHLSQLTGAEFFDAVVEAADIEAVIVRTKSK